MEILNIGPLELILFLLLMFIILGPQDMVNWSRKAGAWLRKLIRSQIWAEIRDYSAEIRELPTKLVRETGLDEDLKEIRDTTNLASDLANVDSVNIIAEANQDQSVSAGAYNSNNLTESSAILNYPTTIPDSVIPGFNLKSSIKSKYRADTFDIEAAPVVPFYLREYVRQEEERIRQEKEAADQAAREAAEKEAAQLAEQQAAEAAKKPRRKRVTKAEAEPGVTSEITAEAKPRRKRIPKAEAETTLAEETDGEVKPKRRSSRKNATALGEVLPPTQNVSASPEETQNQVSPLQTDLPSPIKSRRRKAELTLSTQDIPPANGQESLESESSPTIEPPRKRTPRKKNPAADSTLSLAPVETALNSAPDKPIEQTQPAE